MAQYACVKSGAVETTNLNAHITQFLEPMIGICESRRGVSALERRKHQFRASSYKRAVAALKRLRFKVVDASQLKGVWVRVRV